MAHRITEYNILVDTNIIDLQKTVASHIRLGWQPIGGPFVLSHKTVTQANRVGQAMVCYGKKGSAKEAQQNAVPEVVPARYFVFLSATDDLPGGFYLGGRDMIYSRGPQEGAKLMSLGEAKKAVELAMSYGHPATLISQQLSHRKSR